MKKILLLLLGGILFMTTITGCSTTPEKKSREEIERLFTDFIGMFPTDDYEMLYTKGKDGVEEKDLGIWQLSSYLYTENSEVTSIGVNLSFDIRSKQCKGMLYTTQKVDDQEVKKEYPVYYKDKEILLVDMNALDANSLASFKNFKMLFSLLELNDTYLQSLPSTYHFYNPEVPLYGVNYAVEKDDKNMKAISNAYPDIIPSERSIKMVFEGSGNTWENGTSQTLRIFFDEQEYNWLTASMTYSENTTLDDVSTME